MLASCSALHLFLQPCLAHLSSTPALMATASPKTTCVTSSTTVETTLMKTPTSAVRPCCAETFMQAIVRSTCCCCVGGRGLQRALQLWVWHVLLAPVPTRWLRLADQGRQHPDGGDRAYRGPHPEEPIWTLCLPGELLPSGSRRHCLHLRTRLEPQELQV